MKFNKNEKRIIPEDERLKMNRCLSELERFHSKFFSKKRMGFYRIFGLITTIIICLLLLLLLLSIGLTSNLFESYLKEQGSSLSRTGEIMFSFGSTFFGSIFLAIIFQLISNKDCFGKKQFFMFMEMKTFLYGHLEYSVGELILFFVMLACHLSQDNVTTIMLAIYIIVISIILLVKFFIFQLSSDVKKYFIYIKNKNKYFLFNKWAAIYQYREIAKRYRNNDTIKDAIDLSFAMEKERREMFNKLLDKLLKKANQGVDVVNEQNIIEEYLRKFVKSSYSPYQLIAVGTMMALYNDNYISKINQNNNLKSLDYVAKSLIDTLNDAITNKSNGFINWSIDYSQVRWLSFAQDHLLSFMYNCLDILCVQAGYLASFQLMGGVIEKIIEKIPAGKKQLVAEDLNNTSKKIEEFDSLIKDNVEAYTAYRDYVTKVLNDVLKYRNQNNQ